ncbi:MAG: thioredoxin family protein, partial [Fibromonadales bacterium]|nr:thioredoxin family protein [Fibromonadales bacterium]
WVFGKQAGAMATLKLGLLLCLAAFFAWLCGLIAKPGKPWWRFAILWLVFVAICVWTFPSERSVEQSETDGEWVSFSSAKLDSLQNEGIAVWVNGAADWCITCKMNEAAVFESEEIIKAFAEIPVVKMRANYTVPNDEAAKLFAKYGRSGVPFDLLLTSSRKPVLLSELLTANEVLEALGSAY